MKIELMARIMQPSQTNLLNYLEWTWPNATIAPSKPGEDRMPTVNLPITTTWSKVADASNTELLVTWESPVPIEVATTAADAAPTVNGHRISPDSAISRGVLGAGFVWARMVAGKGTAGVDLVVSK